MSIIDDFADINRRMNRKPELAAVAPIAAPVTEPTHAANAYNHLANSLWGCRPTKPETLDAMKRAIAQQSVSALRAEVERMEQEQDILVLKLLADETEKTARGQFAKNIMAKYISK